MYLKKIEIAGFKSFVKKDVLSFTSPISAIVGPNGSGKSNIGVVIVKAMVLSHIGYCVPAR